MNVKVNIFSVCACVPLSAITVRVFCCQCSPCVCSAVSAHQACVLLSVFTKRVFCCQCSLCVCSAVSAHRACALLSVLTVRVFRCWSAQCLRNTPYVKDIVVQSKEDSFCREEMCLLLVSVSRALDFGHNNFYLCVCVCLCVCAVSATICM